MPDQHRLALVGAGVMGGHHARVISQSARARLDLVVDPSETSGRALAKRFGATWSPELPDLARVDAVVVAAATEAHFDLATQILGQSTALLVEKPVSDSLLRTQQIVDDADRRDLPMMCGFLERYNPGIVTARAFVQQPLHITATRHSPYASRIRTGVSWDLLVHDVDLAIMLMNGRPSTVQARLGRFHTDSAPGADDVAEALLGFPGGSIAQISASRVGQRKIRHLSVYEEERLIEVDLLRRDVTIYRHVSEDWPGDDGRGYRQQTVIDIPELLTSQEPLSAQFERFLDVLDGVVDAAAERATILPPHDVIHRVLASDTAS